MYPLPLMHLYYSLEMVLTLFHAPTCSISPHLVHMHGSSALDLQAFIQTFPTLAHINAYLVNLIIIIGSHLQPLETSSYQALSMMLSSFIQSLKTTSMPNLKATNGITRGGVSDHVKEFQHQSGAVAHLQATKDGPRFKMKISFLFTIHAHIYRSWMIVYIISYT